LHLFVELSILFLSIFGTFVFNSCSTDGNSSNQNNNSGSILPKTIIISDNEGNTQRTDFFYNGNKIDHINTTKNNQGVGVTNFVYNGDFITQTQPQSLIFGGIATENFTYQNGKLISVVSTINGGIYNGIQSSVIFEYSTNGEITRTRRQLGSTDPNFDDVLFMTNSSVGLPSSLTLNNGTNPANGFPQDNSTINYNTTNSVYKNIVGFNNVLSNLYFTDLSVNSLYGNGLSPYQDDLSCLSNLSPINNYSSIDFNTIFYSYDYSYVYNENNYPTSFQVFDFYGQPVRYGTIIYY
jgi:hypothetical protein